MNDTIQRVGKASGIDLPEAVALVSESVWWVTLVDATMIRYHEAAYDRALVRCCWAAWAMAGSPGAPAARCSACHR